MLKYFARYGAAGLLVLAMSTPCFAQTSGADIYKARCQMCHAPDGSGNTPAGKAMGAIPFNSPDVIKMTDSELMAVIKNGRKKMPAFGSTLSDTQIGDVVAHIRSLQKK